MAILVAGDVMLGGNVLNRLSKLSGNIRALKSKFRDAALVANLECPVCNAPVVKPGGFRIVPEAAQEPISLFDVLSVANNHALDCGAEGFRETVDHVQQLGVAVVGYRTPAGYQEGAVVPFEGKKVGFLGYADGKILSCISPSAIATFSEWDKVEEEIRRLRRFADTVICLLHAGKEMSRFPSTPEKTVVRDMITHGADIVVRSHAHVVQGYERIGSSVAFYGLGDFVFDATVWRRRVCGLLCFSELPMEAEWSSLLLRREDDFSLRCLADRSIRAIPTRCGDLAVTIDKAAYYPERALSLLAEY